MIEQKEREKRELVVRLSREYGRKVLGDVIEEWDREGQGFLALFILMNFPIFWLLKARRN